MNKPALILLALLTAAGCSSRLETGYEPRKLGASESERRGYYAPAFSPDARAAENERQQETKARRPTPGF